MDRKIVLPDGNEGPGPNAPETDFQREYIEIIEETGPSMSADRGILVHCEVARRPGFDTGSLIHYANRGGTWVPDPPIKDD